MHMGARIGFDSLARGERHEVCTNVIVCEPSAFITPYPCDTRSHKPQTRARRATRRDALVFATMTVFGVAALALVLAFALMVERIAL